MISELHGHREDVDYDKEGPFRLYHNIEVECYPPHWHTAFEIIMPLERSYTVILEGNTYELQPEDIMIIPSGVMHELIAPKKGSRLIYLVNYSMIQEVNGFDAVNNKFYPCALFPKSEATEEHHEMTKILLQIELEQRMAEPLYEASIHALLLQFFILACRTRLHQNEPRNVSMMQTPQVNIDALFNVCTYINEHCAEPLSLDQVVEKSGFSKSHFMRLFKEYTGVSYNEYLTRRRMRNAEQLLINPEYSIMDVAMHSGFESIATFNRIFKNTHEMTPTDYRKMLRKGHN